MSARVVDLVDAIAQHITSTVYSFTFDVVTAVPQRSDLRETRLTTVYVYPQWETGKGLPIDTRGTFGKQYTIAVHIVNFIDDLNANDELRNALQLAEELEDSLKNTDLAAFAMLQFIADTGGQPFALLESINERNTYEVPILVQYVTVE